MTIKELKEKLEFIDHAESFLADEGETKTVVFVKSNGKATNINLTKREERVIKMRVHKELESTKAELSIMGFIFD